MYQHSRHLTLPTGRVLGNTPCDIFTTINICNITPTNSVVLRVERITSSVTMSGWDDLFDLAAGKQSGSKSVVPGNEPNAFAAKQQKKKYSGIPRTGSILVNDSMLAGRMIVPDPKSYLPSWCRLGTGMLKKKCHGWQGVEKDGKHCRACKKSPLLHRLVPQNEQKEFSASAFCLLRNIRCASFLSVTMGLDELKHVAFQDALSISRLPFPGISPGEAGLLEEKANAILNLAKGKNLSNECNIRLIIACDAFYLRLYYLQISAALEYSNPLPHPTKYFVSSDWRINSGSEDKFATLCESIRVEEVRERFGLQSRSKNHHPLSFLHKQRLIETHSLFQGSKISMSSSFQDKMNEPMKHLSSTLEYHETPAPPILAEWRDSCRDVLCNLYAYATLSSDSIKELKGVLTTHTIRSIIELGAGTGYIARILANQGLVVEAVDMTPPDQSMNEYHGQTPPFYSVKKGTIESLHGRNSVDEALLLCYPPPQSDMAHDALDVFVEQGGTFMIYIGEFAGLTASTSFEIMLKQEFQCILRRPCLTWGTDASSMTVWRKLETPLPTPSLLLPCSKCGEREATRRCRLARHVVYCSQNCFREHVQTLKLYFQFGNITFDVDSLDFTIETHFSLLPSYSTEVLSNKKKQIVSNSSPRFLTCTMKKRQKLI